MKIMPKQFDMACARAKHVLTTAVAGKMYSTILPADSLYNLAKVERVSIEVIRSLDSSYMHY